MILYVDRRVGYWRALTFTTREDYDFLLEMLDGTEPMGVRWNSASLTKGQLYLQVGRPTEALPLLKQAVSDDLTDIGRSDLNEALVAIYGLRP